MSGAEMSVRPIKDATIKIVLSASFQNLIVTRLSRYTQIPGSIKCVVQNKPTKSIKTEELSYNESIQFTTEEIAYLKNENLENTCKVLDLNVKSESGLKVGRKRTNVQTISLADLKWLNQAMSRLRNDDPTVPYLHELMHDCEIILPENEIMERNPELEARCQKLRRQQEAKQYEAMTRNVDSLRTHHPQDTISFQMKQINRQLIAVAQFIFSVAAGFAFGFIGIELIVGQLDFGFRLLLGIMIALIIALAEIYFLAKKLNEEYDVSMHTPLHTAGNVERKVMESIQITTKNSVSTEKLHKD
ncbi:transmembrane protein 199 [Topomyia yanbarensis]|uniref:transmembrane protein 199 n=1 Tax=Topomyia yanbarensis TaxID=2498891 RepID=UPI00273B537C|nr:transmembrane protein 199 [Topomyia yanbarensis]